MCVLCVWDRSYQKSQANGLLMCFAPYSVFKNLRQHWKWAVSHKNTNFRLLLKTWESQRHWAHLPVWPRSAVVRGGCLPSPGTCLSVCRSSCHSAAMASWACTPAGLPHVSYLMAPAAIWLRKTSTFPNILWSFNSSMSWAVVNHMLFPNGEAV